MNRSAGPVKSLPGLWGETSQWRVYEVWMSKFAAFVNSVIWSWTHFRGLNDIKKFASIGVPLDDEDERHHISKTLPTAQQIQGFSAFVKETTQTRAAEYGKHQADDSEVTRGLSNAKYWCAYLWGIPEKPCKMQFRPWANRTPQSKVLTKSNFSLMSPI